MLLWRRRWDAILGGGGRVAESSKEVKGGAPLQGGLRLFEVAKTFKRRKNGEPSESEQEKDVEQREDGPEKKTSQPTLSGSERSVRLPSQYRGG